MLAASYPPIKKRNNFFFESLNFIYCMNGPLAKELNQYQFNSFSSLKKWLLCEIKMINLSSGVCLFLLLKEEI